MENPLRDGARRARSAALRLTRGWAAGEGFSQDGLLAERTISLPRRPPATRQPDPEPQAELTPRDDMLSARVLDLDQLARLRRRSQRAREPERDRKAEECA